MSQEPPGNAHILWYQRLYLIFHSFICTFRAISVFWLVNFQHFLVLEEVAANGEVMSHSYGTLDTFTFELEYKWNLYIPAHPYSTSRKASWLKENEFISDKAIVCVREPVWCSGYSVGLG